MKEKNKNLSTISAFAVSSMIFGGASLALNYLSIFGIIFGISALSFAASKSIKLKDIGKLNITMISIGLISTIISIIMSIIISTPKIIENFSMCMNIIRHFIQNYFHF